MKQKRTRWILFLLISGFVVACTRPISRGNETSRSVQDPPKISFTFDDGSLHDMPGYKGVVWNRMILDQLDKANIKSTFFVAGSFLEGEKGKAVLSSWDSRGHLIANHTYFHPNFNGPAASPEQFRWELLRNDSVIAPYENYTKLFRFPYLKEGATASNRDAFREILAENGYHNGYVTIDASDWYVNSRLLYQLRLDPTTEVQPYEDFYVAHLFDRATFYDSLATDLRGRKIHHALLLHHNLTSALFLGALVDKFRSEGWEIVDAERAFRDPVFSENPMVVPAGESLIWSLAKASGKYNDLLRYPAEDGVYEKPKMDAKGL